MNTAVHAAYCTPSSMVSCNATRLPLPDVKLRDVSSTHANYSLRHIDIHGSQFSSTFVMHYSLQVFTRTPSRSQLTELPHPYV